MSALTFGFFTNPLIPIGIATEVALLIAILYTPVGHWLFGTAAFGGDV